MDRLFWSRLRNRWIKRRMRGKELPSAVRANLNALDHLDLDEKAKDLSYVVFDMETTGLSLKRDRVLSVAAFRVVEGRIRLGDAFGSMVSPGRSIPASAIKVHGIVPDMVALAPSFTDVLDRFLGFVGADILVGYHVHFDLHFLNRCMRHRYGFPLQNLALDAESMCRKTIIPAHLRSYTARLRGSRSLDALAGHFGIEVHERHTAMGDAMATAMIFQRILAELERKGPGRLRDLLAVGAAH